MIYVRDFLKEWKENVLNPYCREECKENPCCTDMRLMELTKKEVRRVFGVRWPRSIRKLEKQGLIEKDSPRDHFPQSTYSLLTDCPRFVDGQCGIYEKRPENCRQYPFIRLATNIDKIDIVVYGNCEFVKNFPEETTRDLRDSPFVRDVYIIGK